MSESKKIKRNFHKRYDFSTDQYKHLPKNIYNTQKWSIEILQKHKHELNQVKSLLSNFDFEKWWQYTKTRDNSTVVTKILRNRCQPELVTQAWFKFYDCLNTYAFIPKEAIIDDELSSVHLCEAPGAFIAALNHYLALNWPQLDWRWYATTLNPDHEANNSSMISDDRLLRHTYNHWLFGADFTGDIMKFCNHLDLVKNVGKVWLVTADGSIDCHLDPGNQERLVEYLHYCETITALAILKKGGSFLLKIFTIFEDTTVCLLYLLNIAFKQVSVFKPVCSKGGSSEVYVVCLEYQANLSEIWDDLIQPYKNGQFDPDYSMFDLNEINNDFISEINDCANYFKMAQIDVIETNIAHYGRQSADESARIYHMHCLTANELITNHNLRAIPKKRRLVPHLELRPTLYFSVPQFVFSNNLLSFDRRDLIADENIGYYVDLRVGGIMDEVRTSRFCTLELLKNFQFPYNRTICDLFRQILKKIGQHSTIVDVHENYCNYVQLRQDFFDKILNADRNFLIIGVPFLTNFLAGLLQILISCYDRIYVHKSGFILLYNRLDERFNSIKKNLEFVDEQYKSLTDRDICQIIPYDLVHNNDYFNFLYNYNNLVLTKHWRCS